MLWCLSNTVAEESRSRPRCAQSIEILLLAAIRTTCIGSRCLPAGSNLYCVTAIGPTSGLASVAERVTVNTVMLIYANPPEYFKLSVYRLSSPSQRSALFLSLSVLLNSPHEEHVNHGAGGGRRNSHPPPNIEQSLLSIAENIVIDFRSALPNSGLRRVASISTIPPLDVTFARLEISSRTRRFIARSPRATARNVTGTPTRSIKNCSARHEQRYVSSSPATISTNDIWRCSMADRKGRCRGGAIDIRSKRPSIRVNRAGTCASTYRDAAHPRHPNEQPMPLPQGHLCSATQSPRAPSADARGRESRLWEKYLPRRIRDHVSTHKICRRQ